MNGLLVAECRQHEYRNAAEIIYPGLGGWTYDKFEELNDRYFEKRVPLMPIRWHLTLPYGSILGRAFRTGAIELGMYVHKDWNLRDKKPCMFGEHVLLHEMLHHYLWAIGENADHQSDSWCREIMRIGVGLGMRPFVAEREKVQSVRIDGHRKSKRITGGDLLRTQVSRFPYFAFDYRADTLLPNFRGN